MMFSDVTEERLVPDYFAHEWYHAGRESEHAWNVWFVCEVLWDDDDALYYWKFLRCELWWGPWHSGVPLPGFT